MTDSPIINPRNRWRPIIDALYKGSWADAEPATTTAQALVDSAASRTSTLARFISAHPEAMIPATLALDYAVAWANVSMWRASKGSSLVPLLDALIGWHDLACEILDLLDPIAWDSDEARLADANHDLRGADHA